MSVVARWIEAKNAVAVTNSRIEGTHPPILIYTADEWEAFMTQAKSGALDLDALKATADHA